MVAPLKPKPVVALAVQQTSIQPITDMTQLALPSQYEDRLAQYAQEARETESPKGLKTIGTRAGLLTVDGDTLPDNKLRCIILHHMREHQYFDPSVPYDENNPTSPICFALYEGKDLTNVMAHEASTQPQNPQEFLDPEDESKTIVLSPCQTCPQFKWRSAGGGRKGKACREVRRVGLIAADGLTLDTLAVTEIRRMKIPTMSVPGWANYLSALAEVNRPPFAVITEISTVPDQQSNFRITFKPIAPVPDEFMEQLFTMIDAVKEPLSAPYDASATAEAEPAPEEVAEAAPAQVAKVAPRPVPPRAVPLAARK
jgi:hypothetical protein